jgi:LPS-assembly protein
VNIKFYNKLISFFSSIALLSDSLCCFIRSLPYKNIRFFSSMKCILMGMGVAVSSVILLLYHALAYSDELVNEPVQACVIARDVDLTDALRAKFAHCLGWKEDQSSPVCFGSYQPLTVTPLESPDQIRILADRVSFYQNQRSTLSGHVEIQQTQSIVNAQTAYVYRDPKTNQVTKIELLGEVRYLEPGKLMIAKKAIINPQDKSGQTEDVLYRLNIDARKALLPAWGRARLIQRFANKDYLLRQATYTTCAPQDKAWDIQADSIKIDDANANGVARNVVIHVNEWPVFYTPYLSFPTNKDRKSGFLMPLVGYSNVGGFDFGLPYYWNIAPNYDLTIVPHVYTERGFMMGGEYRYLSTNSSGVITGNYLPKDKAFNNFLLNNESSFPWLKGMSTDRWYYGVLDTTSITPNLQLNVNAQQVSDDYYLQDFSTNLALITQRQLLRQVDLNYTTDHWTFRGMGQSYQTLRPVNETPIASVYERLPQLMARGYYYDLPFNANLNILGQYDQFHWPSEFWNTAFQQVPQGPRFHFNPILSVPIMKSWGYITPSVQFVENYYEVTNNTGMNTFNYNTNNWSSNYFYFIDFNRNLPGTHNINYNRTIPRYSVDSGLYFERDYNLSGNSYIQTLEPRLFYLRVPYQNQAPIPVYDSGNMIFNVDQ